MDPWTLAATAAVAAATLAAGAVLARSLVRSALAPGGLVAAAACVLVVGSLALGAVLSPLVGGLAAGLAVPLLEGLANSQPDGSSGAATRSGAVVALAGALGPVLAWTLWRTVGRRPAPPGLVAALAAAVGALVALGAPVDWPAVLGRALLSPLAGLLAAALVTAALVVLVSWALRHATPEPVHRRSRALAPLTTTLLGIGAGLQVMGVARLLLAPTAPIGQSGPGGWTDLLLAGALALGAAAWLATRLHRESPVRRVSPVQALAAGATGAAVLTVAAVLGAVVPVRLVVGGAASGAAAVSGQRALSAPLLRLGWSAAALVPVSALVGLVLGAVLGAFV